MHCRKIFGASGDAPSSFSQPALAGFVFVATDLKRGAGRGTRKMGGRGSCRAETYRQIVKSANRQVGKRQRVANSEWQMALTTHPRWVATNSKQAKACYLGCGLRVAG